MFKKIAFSCLLLAASAGALAETLMECAKIDDVNERVACYDRLSGRVESRMDEPQVGTTAERVEARNRSIAAEVVGHSEQAPEILTLTIASVIHDRNRRVTFVAEDGRRFSRSTSSTLSFSPGDVVRIEKGVASAIFLVRSDGRKIKVKEIG